MQRDEPDIRVDVVEQLILAMVRLDRQSIARLRGVTIRHKEREAAEALLLALMAPSAVYLKKALGRHPLRPLRDRRQTAREVRASRPSEIAQRLT